MCVCVYLLHLLKNLTNAPALLVLLIIQLQTGLQSWQHIPHCPALWMSSRSTVAGMARRADAKTPSDESRD